MRHDKQWTKEWLCPKHSVTEIAYEPPVCWIEGCDVVMVRSFTPGEFGFEPHRAWASWSAAQIVRFMYYEEGYPYAS